MEFREASVTEATAHALLEEYFTSRELSFTGPRPYRTVFPNDDQFRPPRGVFLTAAFEGEPVGCGGVRRIDSPQPGVVRFEVKHLWLREHVRGRGLGRELLAELERRAAEFGATELVLDTNASLIAAGGLYRSSGYRQIAPYNDNPNATHWFGKNL